MGTIDGVKSESAGKVSYAMPAGGMRSNTRSSSNSATRIAGFAFGDDGDHIGPMSYRFARFMIGPLLKTGQLPKVEPLTPATMRSD